MATVEATITVDASRALRSLKAAQRQTTRLAIDPVVAAWCPDLNHYAKGLFINELLDAIGGDDALR